MPRATKNDPGYKVISITPMHLKGAETLYFSSIISEFVDSYTPRWTPVNVFGRMDPVSSYGGTGRELTLGFRVISDDREEASDNMRKIQKLIQYQYPSYTTVSGVPILAAPPYFKLKFLNAVGGGKRLQGYLSSALQINPGFQAKEQSQYFSDDIANVGSNTKLLFADVNVVLRLQVLHEGLIGSKIDRQGQFYDGTAKGNLFPYGVKGAPGPAQAAPPPPTTNTKTGDEGAGPDPSQQADMNANEKKGENVPKDQKAQGSQEKNKDLEKNLQASKQKTDILGPQDTG